MQHGLKISFSQTEPYTLSDVEFTLDGELSHFTNSNAIIDKATRFHLEPKASYGYQEYAWSFLSEFSILHTNYKQEGDLANSDYADSVSRTLPKVRLYSQLNFERDTTLVTNGIQTLEPQLQYLYTPDKDQSDIGLYDTTKLQDDFFWFIS